MNYLNWHICHFSNLLAHWDVYINLDEVERGYIERAFCLQVYNFLCHRATILFGNIILLIYLYRVARSSWI